MFLFTITKEQKNRKERSRFVSVKNMYKCDCIVLGPWSLVLVFCFFFVVPWSFVFCLCYCFESLNIAHLYSSIYIQGPGQTALIRETDRKYALDYDDDRTNEHKRISTNSR